MFRNVATVSCLEWFTGGSNHIGNSVYRDTPLRSRRIHILTCYSRKTHLNIFLPSTQNIERQERLGSTPLLLHAQEVLASNLSPIIFYHDTFLLVSSIPPGRCLVTRVLYSGIKLHVFRWKSSDVSEYLHRTALRYVLEATTLCDHRCGNLILLIYLGSFSNWARTASFSAHSSSLLTDYPTILCYTRYWQRY